MKKTITRFTTLFLCLTGSFVLAQAPTPELLYYKFNGTGTSVPNLASAPPAGTTTATIVGGQTQGSTGQCGGALIGNGLTSTSNYVNTNWTTNLNGTSWTLSFWTSNVPSTTSTYYILGDLNAGGFRVFTGGVANPGNWILRGGFTDVLATGGAATGPTLTTFVYDMPNNQIRSYVNGVLNATVAQTTVSISGSGPFKVGGYSSSASLPSGSLMDEFRLYNRALSVTEIQSLLITNSTSTINPISCTSTYTAPSGATYNTAGTYTDVIPNANGCDSTITINLTFSTPVASSLAASACSSYTAPSGAVFTSSGTYTDTIATANGCDSVITINLTVNQPSSSTLTATACSSYLSPAGNTYNTSGTYSETIPNSVGCDSAITINLSILQPSASSVTTTVCGMYTAPSGATYSSTGIYTDIIPNSVGCDSVITIDLTVLQPSAATIPVSACSSYTSPGGLVITSSGTYFDTIPNMAGCDSVLTITATIMMPTTATIAPVACDSFLSPSGTMYYTSGTYTDVIPNAEGCDSTITINLTVNQPTSSTITTSSCGTYTAPSGALLNSSGVYTDVIPNMGGCDSVITINLTINTVNVAVTQAGATLTSSASGATYQWIDCSNNSPVAGATSQSFTATANGNYAVIVTENSCSDTSACLSVTGIGITENNFGTEFTMYPNPSQGNFTIDLGAAYSNATIVVTDMTGRVIQAQDASGKQVVPVEINAAPGVYFVRINIGDQTAVLQLVKE
jgi:hypothetical protein